MSSQSTRLVRSHNELIEKILQEVGRHAGDRPQMDDMTLVVVQRQG